MIETLRGGNNFVLIYVRVTYISKIVNYKVYIYTSL